MALSTRTSSRPAVGVTRARQARLGRPVLWVLLCSLLLVVIGFLAAYVWKAGDFAKTPAPTDRVQSQTTAGAFQAPPPNAAARQNYQSGGLLAPQNHGNPGQPDQSKSARP